MDELPIFKLFKCQPYQLSLFNDCLNFLQPIPKDKDLRMANIKYKMGNKFANMSELIKNLENTSNFINGLETSSGFA